MSAFGIAVAASSPVITPVVAAVAEFVKSIAPALHPPLRHLPSVRAKKRAS